MNLNTLLEIPPHELAAELKKGGITRFSFIFNSAAKALVASPPQFGNVAAGLAKDRRDFFQHEGLFFQVSEHSDSILGAFVHSTRRGQAQGGTRFWSYPTFEQYLRDGLRLSLGMTRKNALAGLWWGGGKGVISRDPKANLKDAQYREKLFNEFGAFVSSLQGCYITAKDVGTTDEDVASIFAKTRFVTCIPPTCGGSGSPSQATALGVVRGIEAALAFQKKGTLSGKTLAIQGSGNVAEYLVDYLFKEGVKHLTICDISKDPVEKIKNLFKGQPLDAKVVTAEDMSIFSSAVDIFVPCATGAILNSKTIPLIKAPIVCGAANNQLEDPVRDDEALHAKGILYVPDFLVNRMGIVNCANEQYGYTASDSLLERHLDKEWEQSVYQMTQIVLQRSQATKRPPGECANELADELARNLHPFTGHRGADIIRTLSEKDWARSKPW